MAGVRVADGRLHVSLNVVERIAALRWREISVALEAVRTVEVVDRPWASGMIRRNFQIGVVTKSRPARRLATVGPRARTLTGGRALIVVYNDGPCLYVTAGAEWEALLISIEDAATMASEVAHALRR